MESAKVFTTASGVERLGSFTASDEPNNDYALAVFRPWDSEAVRLPDDQSLITHAKKINYNRILTGLESGLIVWAFDSMHPRVHLFRYNDGLGRNVYSDTIEPDQFLSEDYRYGRSVAGGIRLYSNTVASGTFEISGSTATVMMQELDNVHTLGYNSVLALASNGFGLVSPIAEGVVALKPPAHNQMRLFHTGNTFSAEEVFVERDVFDPASPGLWDAGVVAAPGTLWGATTDSGFWPVNTFGEQFITVQFEGNFDNCTSNLTLTLTIGVETQPIGGPYVEENVEFSFHAIRDDITTQASASYSTGRIRLPKGQISGAALQIISGSGQLVRLAGDPGPYISFTYHDLYSKTYVNNCQVIAFQGLDTNQKITLEGVHHWEATPNVGLIKNVKARYDMYDPDHLVEARSIYLSNPVSAFTVRQYEHMRSFHTMVSQGGVSTVYAAAARKHKLGELFKKGIKAIQPYAQAFGNAALPMIKQAAPMVAAELATVYGGPMAGAMAYDLSSTALRYQSTGQRIPPTPRYSSTDDEGARGETPRFYSGDAKYTATTNDVVYVMNEKKVSGTVTREPVRKPEKVNFSSASSRAPYGSMRHGHNYQVPRTKKPVYTATAALRFEESGAVYTATDFARLAELRAQSALEADSPDEGSQYVARTISRKLALSKVIQAGGPASIMQSNKKLPDVIKEPTPGIPVYNYARAQDGIIIERKQDVATRALFIRYIASVHPVEGTNYPYETKGVKFSSRMDVNADIIDSAVNYGVRYITALVTSVFNLQALAVEDAGGVLAPEEIDGSSAQAALMTLSLNFQNQSVITGACTGYMVQPVGDIREKFLACAATAKMLYAPAENMPLLVEAFDEFKGPMKLTEDHEPFTMRNIGSVFLRRETVAVAIYSITDIPAIPSLVLRVRGEDTSQKFVSEAKEVIKEVFESDIDFEEELDERMDSILALEPDEAARVITGNSTPLEKIPPAMLAKKPDIVEERFKVTLPASTDAQQKIMKAILYGGASAANLAKYARTIDLLENPPAPPVMEAKKKKKKPGSKGVDAVKAQLLDRKAKGKAGSANPAELF